MLSMDLTERDEYFSASDEHTKKEYHHHILHDIMMFALLCSQLPFFWSYTESHKVWAAGTHNPWFSPAAPSQVCLLMIFPTFSCFLSPCLTI